MKYPELPTEEKNEILLGIVTDAIMFERIYRIVDALANIYDPSKSTGCLDALGEYYGLYNAFALLGYRLPETMEEEEEIFPTTNKLNDIFENVLKGDNEKPLNERENAKELANKILEEWKNFLN